MTEFEITTAEAQHYQMLKSRATVSDEAQELCAAKLTEAMQTNQHKSVIEGLRNELLTHHSNITRFQKVHDDLTARVEGAAAVPSQVEDVNIRLAAHDKSRKPDVPAGTNYGMAIALNKKRSQRIQRKRQR